MAVTPCGLNGPRIARDEGGVNDKPPFTRKIFFLKEAPAFAFFPDGFGEDEEFPCLPRLALAFNRKDAGTLRLMVNDINAA